MCSLWINISSIYFTHCTPMTHMFDYPVFIPNAMLFLRVNSKKEFKTYLKKNSLPRTVKISNSEVAFLELRMLEKKYSALLLLYTIIFLWTQLKKWISNKDLSQCFFYNFAYYLHPVLFNTFQFLINA